MDADRSPLFCDAALAARIERAEAQLMVAGADAANRRRGDGAGFVIPVAGGVASFAEAGSPFNKVAGLGFAGVPDAADLDALERAYAAVGAPVQVELAHVGDPEIGALLTARGYRLAAFGTSSGRALDGGLERETPPGGRRHHSAGVALPAQRPAPRVRPPLHARRPRQDALTLLTPARTAAFQCARASPRRPDTHHTRGAAMSVEENKAIVGRWFTEFWGNPWNPDVIDELAAPDIRFEYSMHAPCTGRDEVRAFATAFRAAFPDLGFAGAADLIAEGDHVVGRWEGGGTHTGEAFDDLPLGSLPAGSGKRMHFTGTTVVRVRDGMIAEEVGLDDGVTVLKQLGLIPQR
jgi:predicted ester cyclase